MDRQKILDLLEPGLEPYEEIRTGSNEKLFKYLEELSLRILVLEQTIQDLEYYKGKL